MITDLFVGKRIDKSKNVLFWTVMSGVVYSLQSLLFLAIIQRVMKDEMAGIYSAGFVVASQVLSIAKYCVRNYQVSDINEKYSFDDYFATRIVTCMLALMVGVIWVIIAGFDYETTIVAISLCVYKIADALSDVFEGLYQQKFRFDVSGKSQFVKDLLMIIQYVGMIVVTKNLILSTVVLAVFSLILLVVVDVPVSRRFVKWKLVFHRKHIWRILIACFALFVSSFVQAYLQQAPKYAIMGIDGGKVELAKFNELFMPVYLFSLVAGFSLRIWLTKMTLLHEEGNRKGLINIIFKQVFIIVGLMFVACTGMYFLGGPVLSAIYGTNLYGYQWFHIVIMIAGGVSAWFELFENVLIIHRKQSLGILASIVTSLVALAVMPFFVRRNGLMGAAVGFLAINFVRFLLYLILVLIIMKKEKVKGNEQIS